VLAHILAERAAGRLDRPSLLIVPTSLVGNWRAEIARFAPDLKVLVLHGAERDVSDLAGCDLAITTYALLPRDIEELAETSYHLVILDEAQNIKNPAAKAALAARRLDAHQRLCLTGTPMENHLGELWSLSRIATPGLLGERTAFRKAFRTPIEKHGNEERQALLRRRVRPFLLRRTKDDVARELPAKTEILETVELDKGQRDLYETVRLAMDKRVRERIQRQGLAKSQITILDALLKLRQTCCDPRLVKLESARAIDASAKLDRLMELLESLLEEGRRVLVFSQFTSMLALIEEVLERRRVDYVKLTGQTRDRETPVRRFQAGEVGVFLISLKAGGTGLNLTAADVVIHYDPWWNPAVEQQATDRAHRIGQDKPVFVYRLMTRGTVEERMLELQARKKQLTQALYTDEGSTGQALTDEDIEYLLAPLPGAG
jgi:SNF2 family DNA or RNA helicase